MSAPYTPKRDEALFRLDGDLLIPGVLTRGPWYEGTLHGSAMLAAIARAAEQHPTDVPRQVVRLTVDMMRAAPMQPLRVATSTLRAGKSIDHVDVAMFAGDELCVRASALRIRTVDLVVDDGPDTAHRPPAPASDDVTPPPFSHPGAESPAFHHAIDVHIDLDSATVWFRLAVPVVEGEANSSLVAVAAIADWTYATPHVIAAARGTHVPPSERAVQAINADTTINVFRPMVGSWLGVQSTVQVGSIGAGASGAQLFDEVGLVGFSTQSVLVRGSAGAPLAVKEVSA